MLGRRFICPIGPATEREFILDWRIYKATSILYTYILVKCICILQWFIEIRLTIEISTFVWPKLVPFIRGGRGKTINFL